MVERVGARAEIQLGIFDILHRGAADIGQAASGESDVDIVVRSRSRLRHLQGVEAGAAVDHVIVVTSPIDNRVVPGVAADIVVALSAGGSEARRVGKAGVRTCRTRWARYH